LRDGIARAFHRLALLMGETPGPVESIVGEKPVPQMPATFPVGVPADLVRRRPDVRAAERRVAFETAMVGVATADLYPSFSLDGTFGLTAEHPGDLLDLDSRRFSFGPSFRWDLLDFGRVKNQIGVQNARVEEALAAWEKTALGALQEVEDAISGVVNGGDRRDRLARAEESAQRAAALANELYRAGLRDFQSVLDAERQLLSIADQRAAARATVVLELVRLYKALGGGWSLDPEPAPPVAPEPTPPVAPEPAEH
jgi:NodT family efflux transporter outer membrane factor (OMF) lipoprotein